MNTLSYDEIIENILEGKPFEGLLSDASLFIKVKEYTPYICLAIHNGSHFRDELNKYVNLTQEQRYHEEDPFTGELIASLPIVVIAQDSRYEYDLNRSPEECIYDMAWGTKVWHKKLPEKEKQKSLAKHQAIHNIILQLTYRIIEKFSACLVFDIHSYNASDREYKNPPIFNIGTCFVNKSKYGRFVKLWAKALEKIQLPNVDVSVHENDIFKGMGYVGENLSEKFDDCLVLQTDILKVFANEYKRESYPLVMGALKEGLKKAIIATAFEFSDKLTHIKSVSTRKLLPSHIEKSVLQIDSRLFKFSKGLNTISYVSPINLNTEKAQFFSSKFKEPPSFKYKQLNVNPYKFKEELYRLPIDDIVDVTLNKLYRSVIDYLAIKIELLASIGTNDFLYNSLKFYGEPSENDIKNAKFILHIQNELPNTDDEIMPLERVIEAFKAAAISYGINCKVELSNKLVAKALVNSAKKTVLLNKHMAITKQEMFALISHELGIHMVTTFNALDQPLKIVRTGLPYNTLTQEGLAILSEYLCGQLSIKRLKILSLRVVAVSLMLKGYTFTRVFSELIEEYKLDYEEAFTITTRIFRGGGFTKDYLYLRGFKLALKSYQSKRNIIDLLVGKTSFEFYDEITELLERGILNPPTFKTVALTKPAQENETLRFLIDSIR